MDRGIGSWRDTCDKASKVKCMAETRRERTVFTAQVFLIFCTFKFFHGAMLGKIADRR